MSDEYREFKRGEARAAAGIMAASHGIGELDAAWAEAEAVLPERMYLAGVERRWTMVALDRDYDGNERGKTYTFPSRGSYRAWAYNELGDQPDGWGSTPAAALLALAARLRETPR